MPAKGASISLSSSPHLHPTTTLKYPSILSLRTGLYCHQEERPFDGIREQEGAARASPQRGQYCRRKDREGVQAYDVLTPVPSFSSFFLPARPPFFLPSFRPFPQCHTNREDPPLKECWRGTLPFLPLPCFCSQHHQRYFPLPY